MLKCIQTHSSFFSNNFVIKCIENILYPLFAEESNRKTRVCIFCTSVPLSCALFHGNLSSLGGVTHIYQYKRLINFCTNNTVYHNLVICMAHYLENFYFMHNRTKNSANIDFSVMILMIHWWTQNLISLFNDWSEQS